MRGGRQLTSNLSDHERRVLEAFYGGRLSAGQLSTALAQARLRAAAATDAAAAPATAAAPAPALQPVGVAA